MSDPAAGPAGPHSYSGTGYEVDTDDLRADSKIWEGWSVRLGEVDTALDLAVSANNFSMLPGAQDVYVATTKALAALQGYTKSGSEGFEHIAAKLLQSAIKYLQVQTDTQAEIASIQTELDAIS